MNQGKWGRGKTGSGTGTGDGDEKALSEKGKAYRRRSGPSRNESVSEEKKMPPSSYPSLGGNAKISGGEEKELSDRQDLERMPVRKGEDPSAKKNLRGRRCAD